MSNPPEELTEWAVGAPVGNVIEPAASRKTSGWRPDGLDVPPAQTQNWVDYVNHLWNEHFAGSSAHYDKIEDAIDGVVSTSRALVVGETCILDEDDTDNVPGSWERRSGMPTNTGDVVSVDVGGNVVVYTSDNVNAAGVAAWACIREFSGSAIQTYSKTNVGDPKRVITDGVYVAMCYDVYVECWTIDGTQQWVYDHGGIVHDIAMDATHVYICGAESTAGPADNEFARALTLAAGAVTWSYQHSAAASGDILFSIATDGNRVYLSGTASTFAGNYTMRAIRADNGYDANNQGGTGQDLDNRSWDLATTPGVITGLLATDGRRLFAGFAGGNPRLVLGCADGATIHSIASAQPISSVAVDQDNAYFVEINGTISTVFVYSKADMSMIWKAQHDIGGTPQIIYAVASDGAAVFAGLEIVGGGLEALGRLYRGNRPEVWKRVDASNDNRVMRQLLVPGGSW